MLLLGTKIEAFEKSPNLFSLTKWSSLVVILMGKISIESPIQGQSKMLVASTAVVDAKSTTKTDLVYKLVPKG